MSREITTASLTAASGEVVRPLFFVLLDLPDGPVRLTTAAGDVQWASESWLGVGALGSIGEIEETSALQANGVEMSLSGINPDIVPAVLSGSYQGRRCDVWLGFLTEAYQLVADPILLFAGILDQLSIELGDSAAIRAQAQSRLADWERPRVQRYTDASQRMLFAEDRFLEGVNAAANMELVWGRG